MGLTGQDIPPTAGDPDLPQPVLDTFTELAIACNRLVIAIDQAQLLEATALNEVAAAESRGAAVPYADEVADQLARCAISYVEQLAAVYASFATRYVTVATDVATDVLAGQTPTVRTDQVLPSQVRSDPRRLAPLIQVHSDRVPAHLVANQNADLTQLHDTLIETIATMLHGVDVTGYDAPVAAHRSSRSAGLPVEYPQALHAYGAGVAWATTLITARRDLG